MLEKNISQKIKIMKTLIYDLALALALKVADANIHKQVYIKVLYPGNIIKCFSLPSHTYFKLPEVHEA